MSFKSPEQSNVNSASTRANRDRLSQASVFTINLMGGPGCGKTCLLAATQQHLSGKRRLGVIIAEAYSKYDSHQLTSLSEQVLHVNPGTDSALSTHLMLSALERLDLAALDILLIENVSSLIGPARVDLGENAKVAIFSVAAGHELAAKHPDIVQAANLVILNKIDLLPMTSYDLRAFRSTIKRLNPRAQLIEMSTTSGQGIDAWINWLLQQSPRSKWETNGTAATEA